MTNQVARPPIWIVLPNAGLGSRFGRTIPKQYSLIGNKTLIEWTIQALLKVKGIDGFVVASVSASVSAGVSTGVSVGMQVRR